MSVSRKNFCRACNSHSKAEYCRDAVWRLRQATGAHERALLSRPESRLLRFPRSNTIQQELYNAINKMSSHISSKSNDQSHMMNVNVERQNNPSMSESNLPSNQLLSLLLHVVMKNKETRSGENGDKNGKETDVWPPECLKSRINHCACVRTRIKTYLSTETKQRENRRSRNIKLNTILQRRDLISNGLTYPLK